MERASLQLPARRVGLLLTVAGAGVRWVATERRVAEPRTDAGRVWVVLPTYDEAKNIRPMINPSSRCVRRVSVRDLTGGFKYIRRIEDVLADSR